MGQNWTSYSWELWRLRVQFYWLSFESQSSLEKYGSECNFQLETPSVIKKKLVLKKEVRKKCDELDAKQDWNELLCISFY